jgi:hypothetical protein
MPQDHGNNNLGNASPFFPILGSFGSELNYISSISRFGKGIPCLFKLFRSWSWCPGTPQVFLFVNVWQLEVVPQLRSHERDELSSSNSVSKCCIGQR